MRRNLLVIVTVIATALLPATATPTQEQSPVGTWPVTIQGTDRGVLYLTFADNLTLTGYGISRDAAGWFDLAGAWDFDRHGNVVGGFTQFIEAGSRAGILQGRLLGNGRLSANVKTTDGPQKWRAPQRDGLLPDLTGSWVSETITEGARVFQQFHLAPSTNYPGRLDLTGIGINNNGTFDLTGALLVTSDRQVAGFITVIPQSTDGLQIALSGKLNGKANLLKLTGRNQNNQDVRLRAERVSGPE